MLHRFINVVSENLKNANALALVAADILAITLSFVASVLIRYVFDGDYHLMLYWSKWPLVCLFPLFYTVTGLYTGYHLSPPEEFKKIFNSTSLIYLMLVFLTFITKESESYSRGIVLLSWALSIALVPSLRFLVKIALAKRGHWGTPTVIIGETQLGQELCRLLLEKPTIGLKPIVMYHNAAQMNIPDEKFHPDEPLGEKENENTREDRDEAAAQCASVPYRPFEELLSARAEYKNAAAILALPEKSNEEALDVVARIHLLFNRIIYIPNITQIPNLWISPVDFNGILGLEFRKNLNDPKRLITKRFLDFFLASATLVALAPLFAIIAICIKLESKGPVFYVHKRVGYLGKTISLLKFRTMRQNSEQILNYYLNSNSEVRKEWEKSRKLKNDPRVTRVGKILRKFSFDELPQLINVVRGDISVVGPRPIVQEEIDKYYLSSFDEYKQVKPGITGLWQVSGRNNTTYTQRIAYDMYYIRNWSMWFDIYILFKTIPVVLKGHGAY